MRQSEALNGWGGGDALPRADLDGWVCGRGEIANLLNRLGRISEKVNQKDKPLRKTL
jgi:hypothetical protein